MQVRDLYQLPGLVSLETSAKALGMGTSTAYRLHASGSFPVPVQKVGGTFRVRRADLIAYLDPSGVDSPHREALAASAGDRPTLA